MVHTISRVRGTWQLYINMVTNNGISNIEELLAGDAAGKRFTHIAIGTGASPVTGAETALTGQVAKPILTFNYLTGGYIQFNAQIDATDPAINVCEMGLLNADGVLCYRQVITPVLTVTGVVYSLGYKIKLS